MNTDQTQVVFQSGAKVTWNEKGANQVPAVGLEEKRSFTLVVEVGEDGSLLPFQAIWAGKSPKSLPSSTLPSYDEAAELSFRFEFSGGSNYWATEAAMQAYIRFLLVPHLAQHSDELKLKFPCVCIWQIDVWSVQSSLSFRTWLGKTSAGLIADYVPPGCTGLFQPCDVGAQRPLEQAITRSQIAISTAVTVVQNRAPQCLAKAFQALNRPHIVKG